MPYLLGVWSEFPRFSIRFVRTARDLGEKLSLVTGLFWLGGESGRFEIIDSWMELLHPGLV